MQPETERVWRFSFTSKETITTSLPQILWASNRLYAHAVAGEMNRATWVFGCIGLCLMSEVSKTERFMTLSRLTCTLATAVSRVVASLGVWYRVEHSGSYR